MTQLEPASPIATHRWPSRELMQDPYPFYADLRRDAPVVRAPDGSFLVSRWAEVVEVLQQPTLFNQVKGNAIRKEPYPETGEPQTPWQMTDADPPEHRAKRALGLQMVTRERLQAYERMIAEISNELIDAFAERGECEFNAEFAEPLPIILIADVLGFPRDDLDLLRRIGRHEGGAARRFMAEAELDAERADDAEGADYMRRAILDRYESPTDDFLSELVHAQVERDGSLALRYLVAEAMLLLFAGNITTTHMLMTTLQLLLDRPDELARAREDPNRIRPLLEEALRYETPIQFIHRRPRVDTELGGVAIPAGSIVVLLVAAANRDEARFAAPDEFRPDRPENAKHQLAFGRGAHLCLGAPLARMEGQIAFATLLQRLDDITLDRDRSEPGNIPSFVFRSPRRLRLRFRAV